MAKINRKLFYELNIFIFSLLAVLFIIASLTKAQFYELCFPVTTTLFIIDMFLFRKRQILLFIDFYIFLYFFNLMYFFYQETQLSERTAFQSLFLFERVCLFFYLFYFAQFCCYKNRKFGNEVMIKNKRLDISKTSRCAVLIISFFLMLLTFRIGVDMFRTGFSYAAYIKNLKSSSVIPFLFIVFFCVYAFSKGANKAICFFLAFLYLYFCLSRGFRITAIPAVLLIYLVFYEGKINNNLFLLFLFLSFLLVKYVGAIKDTGSFALTNIFASNKTGMILNHHADILYTASTTAGLAENWTIDPLLRIELGCSFFLQSFILPSLFSDKLRYPLVINYFTSTGGGGLFLAAEYLFWGFAGVFLGSYVINKVILDTYKKKNTYFVLFVAVMVVFSCNWISYDFHTILRFPLYAIVIYWIFTHIKWRYLAK